MLDVSVLTAGTGASRTDLPSAAPSCSLVAHKVPTALDAVTASEGSRPRHGCFLYRPWTAAGTAAIRSSYSDKRATFPAPLRPGDYTWCRWR